MFRFQKDGTSSLCRLSQLRLGKRLQSRARRQYEMELASGLIILQNLLGFPIMIPRRSWKTASTSLSSWWYMPVLSARWLLHFHIFQFLQWKGWNYFSLFAAASCILLFGSTWIISYNSSYFLIYWRDQQDQAFSARLRSTSRAIFNQLQHLLFQSLWRSVIMGQYCKSVYNHKSVLKKFFMITIWKHTVDPMSVRHVCR